MILLVGVQLLIAGGVAKGSATEFYTYNNENTCTAD